ncbi:MAG: efflux RND transporter periplasmic adaptor subunit [Bacteroidetes bacterium]|nr:efflux RND transporter periplasmic adaptor subunit [Bacteroidota bacterium]
MRLGLIILTMALAACGGEEANKGAATGSKGLNADIYVVHPEKLDETINVTGSVIPNEQVELKSEESGRLMKISFKEGSHVSKGELLFQIDDRDFQAQAKNIQVQLNLAKSELKRNRELLEAQAISQETYDVSYNKVESLDAQLELLKVRIDRCQIRAPFSGRIGLRMVSEGAFISVGQTLVSLVQENPLKIEFEVPEIYSTRVHTGMQLTAMRAGSDDSLNASIYAYDAQINSGNRNLKVRALDEANKSHWLPGSFVKIRLALEEMDEAILIPTQSLVPELNGQKVFAVKNGVIESIQVKTGIRLSDKIQITEGLQEGDSILTTGILQARNGMLVQVNPANN